MGHQHTLTCIDKKGKLTCEFSASTAGNVHRGLAGTLRGISDLTAPKRSGSGGLGTGRCHVSFGKGRVGEDDCSRVKGHDGRHKQISGLGSSQLCPDRSRTGGVCLKTLGHGGSCKFDNLKGR